MTPKTLPPLPDTAFWRAYQGRFVGLLRWDQVDGFWSQLERDPAGWYLFAPGPAAPEAPLEPAELRAFLEPAAALVNSRRERSHSGAVYVDDLRAPKMVKIFDPSNMGAACAVSGTRSYPRWVLSRLRPDPLPAPEEPAKRGWFPGR